MVEFIGGRSPPAQVLNELMCIDGIALAHMKCRNHFADGIEGNIGVLVAKFGILFPLSGFHRTLFLANERPNLIAFDGPTANAVHLLLHHLFALRADLHQELHDGFIVYTSHAYNGADRTALGKSGDNSEFFSGFRIFMGPPWLEITEGVYCRLPLRV